MAKWCMLVILALAVVASARNMPSDAALEDQKTFGFVPGVGSTGLPFGGMGPGFGGGQGGPSGLGGFGGFLGPNGLGGFFPPANGDGPSVNNHLPLP
ncbi:hypothetical protein RJT34_24510 [Clitoria ternatea]|uniref:Glycine-rich protein n=1 Tax=Clitoria ternatea TaxID=43366 RepID=A0AAN9IHK4_CLITE